VAHAILNFPGRSGDEQDMPLPRALLPRRSVTSYEQSVRDVLGSPGLYPVDSLGVSWAHQIAWAAHSGSLDELEQLSATAARYGVPLDLVLQERAEQRRARPVVPASRATSDAPATTAPRPGAGRR
jgi:hypothetical protein